MRGRAASFVYVETTEGLDVSRFPIVTAARIVRRSVDALVRGHPERGEAYVIAPSTRVNRALLALMRPVMPASVADRITLLADARAARAALEARGIAVPTFFGGDDVHDVERDASGAVDFRAMGARLRSEIEARHAREALVKGGEGGSVGAGHDYTDDGG